MLGVILGILPGSSLHEVTISGRKEEMSKEREEEVVEFDPATAPSNNEADIETAVIKNPLLADDSPPKNSGSRGAVKWVMVFALLLTIIAIQLWSARQSANNHVVDKIDNVGNKVNSLITREEAKIQLTKRLVTEFSKMGKTMEGVSKNFGKLPAAMDKVNKGLVIVSKTMSKQTDTMEELKTSTANGIKDVRQDLWGTRKLVRANLAETRRASKANAKAIEDMSADLDRTIAKLEKTKTTRVNVRVIRRRSRPVKVMAFGKRR